MELGITTLAISAILAVVYVICRLNFGKGLGLFFRLLASYAYIASAILSVIVSTDINNFVYAFILLAITISIVPDTLIEIKDGEDKPTHMINLAMIMSGVHKVFNFVVLTALVHTYVVWQPFVFSFLISLALATLVVLYVRISHLKFDGYLLQVWAYFVIVIYVATLSVWYTFILPKLLLFAISMVLFLISEIILMHVHAGKEDNKVYFYFANYFFYFAAQLVLVAFLYFGFFTNF